MQEKSLVSVFPLILWIFSYQVSSSSICRSPACRWLPNIIRPLYV